MDETAIRKAVEKVDAAPGYSEAVQLLLDAGVRIYYTDLRSHTTFYSSDLATYVDWRMPSVSYNELPVEHFDPAAVHAAILAMERHETDYQGFPRRIWDAGVVEFEVNLLWRQMTFRGVHGESHVEPLPEVNNEALEPAEPALVK